MSPVPPLVGLTLRCFPKEGYADDVRVNFAVAMSTFLGTLKAEYGARFRFFPFYEASAWPDTRALDGVLTRMDEPKIPIETLRWENLADLRRKVAACDAFIGVRFHSVLLAVQAGVPVLAISYAEKTANFMTENGLGRFVIRYEDVTVSALKERWDRLWKERAALKEELARVCAMQKALADRHFDRLYESLRTPRGHRTSGGS